MGLFGPTPKNTGKSGVVGVECIATISAKLVQAGYNVLTPYSVLHQHDLLFEDADGNFWRLWCRVGWLSRDRTCVLFDGSNPWDTRAKGRGFARKTQERHTTDYFAVYSPRLRTIYLIPASHVHDGENALQLVEARNDAQDVRWAEDYKL